MRVDTRHRPKRLASVIDVSIDAREFTQRCKYTLRATDAIIDFVMCALLTSSRPFGIAQQYAVRVSHALIPRECNFIVVTAMRSVPLFITHGVYVVLFSLHVIHSSSAFTRASPTLGLIPTRVAFHAVNLIAMSLPLVSEATENRLFEDKNEVKHCHEHFLRAAMQPLELLSGTDFSTTPDAVTSTFSLVNISLKSACCFSTNERCSNPKQTELTPQPRRPHARQSLPMSRRTSPSSSVQ